MSSYNDIVPTDLQDELIAIRDELSKASFRIGDIVLQIIQEKPDEPIEQIHKAVGLFSGKAQRTVREYASIAAFYPQPLREQYDVLSFDHFRVAMRFGADCYTALDWAVAQLDEINRPATVDAMELQFSGQESSLNYEKDLEVQNDNLVLTILRRLKDLLSKLKLSDDLVRDAVSVIDRIEKQLEKEKVLVVK